MRIDYFGLEQAIQDQLKDDEDIYNSNIKIQIERDLLTVKPPVVVIYLDSREAPQNSQRISAGRRTDLRLRLSLWCAALSFESVSEAAKARDSVIAKVEIALMRDRTLNGNVHYSYLDGGEFTSVEAERGFLSAGEVRLIAETKTTL